MRSRFDKLGLASDGEIILADEEVDVGELTAAQYYDASLAETHRMHEHLPKLAAQAFEAARREAVSYRNFNVGAAVYVLDTGSPDQGGRFRKAILWGANLKPTPESPKWCAEMAVL